MTTLYELIAFIPDTFTPHFAQRLNSLYLFLKKHKDLTAKEATKLYLKDEKFMKQNSF